MQGAMLTWHKVWALSRCWYGDRMSPAFRGRTLKEARRIFASLGLTDDFWMGD